MLKNVHMATIAMNDANKMMDLVISYSFIEVLTLMQLCYENVEAQLGDPDMINKYELTAAQVAENIDMCERNAATMKDILKELGMENAKEVFPQ